MVPTNYKTQNVRLLMPLFGAVVFACLYIIATFFYPGGTQFDEHTKGFSWAQNYWCNLLNENAINGQPNPARPVALAATFILAAALANFWYAFPQYAQLQKAPRLIIQIAGLLSIGSAVLLFTSLHDIVMNVASLCWLIAIIGTFNALLGLRWRKLFWLGIFNVALVVLNNILYYGDGLRYYLPVVQKISFFFALLWISLIDIRLYKRVNA